MKYEYLKNIIFLNLYSLVEHFIGAVKLDSGILSRLGSGYSFFSSRVPDSNNLYPDPQLETPGDKQSQTIRAAVSKI